MFGRRVAGLVLICIVTFASLWWTWQPPAGLALPAGAALASSQRFRIDLGGDWTAYSSLRQAWLSESGRLPGGQPKYAFLAGRNLALPASTAFGAAARSFRVPAEWSARTAILQLSGVQGLVRAYLNGVDTAHFLGEFEGSGALDALEIPAGLLRYGSGNILILQLSAPRAQCDVILGSTWPAQGKITGKIELQAVMETSIAVPRASVAWQGDTAVLSLETRLVHHGFGEAGPWEVNAVLSDGSAEVARAAAAVQAEENSAQALALTLSVPHARRWSPADPFLYQLHLTVMNSRGDQDDLALPLGLRSLEQSEGHWSLNGQPLTVQGLALTPEEEAAVRHSGKLEAWLAAQKQAGVNLIYFSGAFPDELWLQAADHLGMGIWAEWPVAMLPEAKLPDPASLGDLAAAGARHPSLWAWTVAKGLDPTRPGTAGYLAQAAARAQGLPVYALAWPSGVLRAGSGEFDAGAAPDGAPEAAAAAEVGRRGAGLLTIQGDRIAGSWGEVRALSADGLTATMAKVDPQGAYAPLSLAPKAGLGGAGWPQEKMVAAVWAALLVWVAWMCISSAAWRYREINESKPKRALRSAWFWHGLAMFMRAGTLAALATAAMLRLPSGLGPWLPHLWPALEILQRQSSWLLWLALTLILHLARLLQVGLAAPGLPGRPRSLGLACWLERRYYWLVLVGLAWALLLWLAPTLPVPAAALALAGYAALSLLFWPIRIRDIRKPGGRYLPFLLVPGLVGAAGCWWLIRHYPDLIFLYHWLRS